ncbi:MAG: glycosyltransferase family 39 protein, partial [Candidatus Gracilibacteria bacterium]|nr:glycosyltransferase family 39 protein [Candidatus Gracilibacteria bacterium]
MFQAFFFILISFIGTIIHYYFLPLNDVLKNSDSFAYLQMATNLANFHLSGFGTGWFGFIYSFPIAIFNFITGDLFFLSKIINLLYFVLGGFFLYKILKKYLEGFFLFLPLILYYLSSSLIFFNIQTLSENIYIPLFLALIYIFLLFIEKPNFKKIIGLSIIFALLYLTRAEAFIYLGSSFLVFFYLFITKKINFKKSVLYFGSLILGFFLLISPYIYYLHTITGEWGLTNKGSSNLRQATMRGIDKMDDDGFEKAVGELTPDKHHLIAGFAGGLKYDKSYSTGSTRDFLLGNPSATLARIGENQLKLYSQNIPKILIGDYIKLAF